MSLSTKNPIAVGKDDAPFSSDPRVIYLAPRCCYSHDEGRAWFEDNVWPCDDCPDPTKARVAQYALAAQMPGPGARDETEYWEWTSNG